MREILFRGKRVDNGEWVVSNSIMQTNYSGTFLWYKGCWVEAESVGEYTGLTDKKGKKIFEGDIVKGYFNDKLIRGVVVYGNEATFFIQRKGLCGIGLNNGEIWMEVIGNIHDNPEKSEEK